MSASPQETCNERWHVLIQVLAAVLRAVPAPSAALSVLYDNIEALLLHCNSVSCSQISCFRVKCLLTGRKISTSASAEASTLSIHPAIMEDTCLQGAKRLERAI